MSEPKWTPGPWRCGWDYKPTGTSGFLVAYARGPEHVQAGVHPFPDEPQIMQPAKVVMDAVYVECALISAAPELYEALFAAEEELRLIRMKDTAVVYNPGLRPQMSLALAKARGEMP